MKLKIRISLLIQIIAVTLFSCKKSETCVASGTSGYFRLVFQDTSGLFYLDKKINANGDSVVLNPDGTNYNAGQNNIPDQFNSITTLYASGGWNDNSSVSNPGVYGYVTDPRVNGFYTYFPNATHRNKLAPVIQGINYVNWAETPSGNHFLEIKTPVPVFVNGVIINSDLVRILGRNYFIEPGAVQTAFVVNRASSFLLDGGFPFNGTNYVNQFSSLDADLVTISDHPGKFDFKDTCAYIRFVNFTPPYLGQAFTSLTEFIDVYVAPIDPVSGLDGNDTLASDGIGRYANTTDQPFLEISLGAWSRGDTVGQVKYFRVSIYSQGQSKAKGFVPLASSILPVFFKYTTIDNALSLQPTLNVDSWLIRSDGKNYFPTINTIAIAASNRRESGRAIVLRSCISYQREGLNRRYLK